MQQLVAQIPWGHNITILDKVKSPQQREYYLKACIEQGWSRSVLVHQIESGLYERDLQEGKHHNFTETLPSHLAEQAQEALKSQYNLEFLGLDRQVRERELEKKLKEKKATSISSSLSSSSGDQRDASINKRQKQFLSTLSPGTPITSSEYAEKMSISPSTALRDLRNLVKKGYLTKKGKGRGSHFCSVP